MNTRQIKIKKNEQAELYICKRGVKCDNKNAGGRMLLNVVGPIKINICIKKRGK